LGRLAGSGAAGMYSLIGRFTVRLAAGAVIGVLIAVLSNTFDFNFNTLSFLIGMSLGLFVIPLIDQAFDRLDRRNR
jgi:hypothetical protein